MIVLLISHEEAEALLKGKPDVSLKQYLASEHRQERLLPDDNLPVSVLLERLDGTDRSYLATIRTYADQAGADRAWETKVR